MEKIKRVWEIIKKIGSWLSYNFKELFLKPKAVLSWIFVILIFLCTNGPHSIFNINIVVLYLLIFGLVLTNKVN